MPKVSVIVPVYNAQHHLFRCVNSIQAQSLSDIEIILVDDGSTDESSLICADLMNVDYRIKYYHQDNSGVSVARQKGLELSTGQYIIHVDSDDWIEPSMLEEMYNEACKSNNDVVICDVITESLSVGSRYYPQKLETSDNKSIFVAMIYGDLLCSVVNKLIKKEVIDRFNIHFIPGLNTGEDLLFCCSLYRYEVKTSFVNKAFYHYDLYTNNNSITRNITLDKVKQRVVVSELLFDGLDESDYIDEKNYLLWKNVNMAFRSGCDCKYFYSMFTDAQIKDLITREKHGINNVITKRCIIYAIKGHLNTARIINDIAMRLLKPIYDLFK